MTNRKTSGRNCPSFWFVVSTLGVCTKVPAVVLFWPVLEHSNVRNGGVWLCPQVPWRCATGGESVRISMSAVELESIMSCSRELCNM